MIDTALRRLVRERAGNRCEYCQFHQEVEPFITYQIEHIIAIQHGGQSHSENLALACSHCNLHKGPNLAGIDPLTDQIVPLFHPRLDSWPQHFEILGDLVAGLTACGRTTVRVLMMNAEARVELRTENMRNPFV